MEYKITNVQRRGEWGDQMIDYAIALEGQQGWIKLTQKLSTPPPEIGSPIRGTIERKTNRNGNSYLKFTKERANGAGGSGADSPKLDYIIQMLEELTDRRQVPDTVHPVPEDSEEPKFDDPFDGMGI